LPLLGWRISNQNQPLDFPIVAVSLHQPPGTSRAASKIQQPFPLGWPSPSSRVPPQPSPTNNSEDQRRSRPRNTQTSAQAPCCCTLHSDPTPRRPAPSSLQIRQPTAAVYHPGRAQIQQAEFSSAQFSHHLQIQRNTNERTAARQHQQQSRSPPTAPTTATRRSPTGLDAHGSERHPM